MKKWTMVVFACGLFLCAQALAAAHEIKISGDAARDGKLQIDVSWKIDTKNFPGKSTAQIRQIVADELWKDLLPQLVKKTSGLAVSYDRSNFVRVAENSRLIEQRTDGSKVYDLSTEIQFTCVYAEGAKPEKSDKDREDNFNRKLRYRFVREGID